MSTDPIAGRYLRLHTLGRGAMGEVWLADDLVLRRQVAVKQIRVDHFSEPDGQAYERIAREARVAAQLTHPNVVAVYDLVSDGGQPYLVMEYVPGETLADRIRRAGPVPLPEAAAVFASVAAALEAAHRIGVVHRDVKPSNVLITPDGQVKLADFGVARRTEEATLTNLDNAVGTVAYMAPEVARGVQANEASDLWSLGASLYAAVEGHAPHGGTGQLSTATLLVRLVTEPVPVPARAGGLAPVLARLLSVDPAGRPSAAAAARMLADAGRALGTVGSTMPRASVAADPPPGEVTTRRPVAPPIPPGPPAHYAQYAPAQAYGAPWSPGPPPAADRPRRGVLVWAGAAGAVVAAALVVLVLVLTSSGSSSPQTAGNGGPGTAVPSDTGAAPGDTVPSDAVPSDTGPSDAGPSDTGPSDTGPSDAGPTDVPSDTPTTEDSYPPPAGPVQLYHVNQQVGPEDGDCVDNSYGKVQDFLASSGGCSLSRSLYSARTSGHAVTVSVAIVDLADPSQGSALVNLATSNGTGDIRTLVEDGEGYPGSPSDWTQDPTFYATVDDAGSVEIVEVMWSDASIATHENNPTLYRLITSIAPDVTG